jgi:small GTP-binding protein
MLRNIKVIVAGEKTVGKTSLVEQYTLGKFSGQYSHSLGLNVTTHIAMAGNRPVKLELWDIAGEYFERTEFYRNAVACMLVYDVTKEKTLQQLATWLNVCRTTVPSAGIVVVGNKADLGYRFPEKWGEFFAKYANAPHLTASARTGENVDLIFSELAKQALETRENNSPARGE